MVRIQLTPNLHRYVDSKTIELDARPHFNLRNLLEQFFAQAPRLGSYIVDDQGEVRKHVVIFVDGEQINDRQHQNHPLKMDSEVYIMQALSGG